MPADSLYTYHRGHEQHPPRNASGEEAHVGRSGLTHTRYLVLLTLGRLQRETDDASMQRDVAEAAGLDKATTSSLVGALEERGWISRGIDGLDARRWRLIITPAGQRLLARATLLVEAASRSEVAPPSRSPTGT